MRVAKLWGHVWNVPDFGHVGNVPPQFCNNHKVLGGIAVRNRHLWSVLAILALAVLWPLSWSGAAAQEDDLAKKLSELDPRILTVDKDGAKPATNMVWEDIRARVKMAN